VPELSFSFTLVELKDMSVGADCPYKKELIKQKRQMNKRTEL